MIEEVLKVELQHVPMAYLQFTQGNLSKWVPQTRGNNLGGNIRFSKTSIERRGELQSLPPESAFSLSSETNLCKLRVTWRFHKVHHIDTCTIHAGSN